MPTRISNNKNKEMKKSKTTKADVAERVKLEELNENEIQECIKEKRKEIDEIKKLLEEQIKELEESKKELELMQLLQKKHIETMEELFPNPQIHDHDTSSQKDE